MKIVVIGSIAAGVSVASRLSANDGNAKITVYEKGAYYSCGVDGLPHYLSESMDELNNAIKSKETELIAAGIHACLLHEVKAINVNAHSLTVCDLSTGRVFEDHYDKLVIAVGSSNGMPNVPGVEKIGIHTLKSVEELVFLKEFIRTPYVRDIVILGATWAGLELAKAFIKTGRKVRIVCSNKQLLPEFDPEVGALLRKQLEPEGVTFNLGEKVIAFTGRTFVEKVKTDRGTYDCDLCVIADNSIPNTTLLAGTGIELAANGAVLVNDDLSTNIQDVYAVGDCAISKNGSLHTRSVRVGNTEIARTGLTEQTAKQAGIRVKCALGKGNDRPGICPNPQKITIKLVCEATTGRILGAQAWGAKNVSTRINAIAVAISAGMTASQLANVDFCFSSADCSIWDPVQIVCGMVK